MFEDFRGFLHFSRSERRGILVLFFLMILLIFSPDILSAFRKPEAIADSGFEQEVQQYKICLAEARTADSLKQIDERKAWWRQKQLERRAQEKRQQKMLMPYPFDPNTITKYDMEMMGLPERVVRSIENYRSKGGRFYRSADVAKIYTIDSALFLLLEPFVNIPESKPEFTSGSRPEFKKKVRKYESVNPFAADSIELQLVPGIGPSFARRIVRYRERLGGFHSLEQLLEVYGVHDTLLSAWLPHFKLESGSIKTLNINLATKEELAAHPYIDYTRARLIVKYRQQHGAFSAVEDLKRIHIIDDAFLAEVSRYLTH